MIATFFIRYEWGLDAEDASNLITRWLDEQYVAYLFLEESCWFAVLDLTTEEIRDHLLGLINSDDSLLVFEVGPGWSAWNFPGVQVKWLKENWKPGLPRVK